MSGITINLCADCDKLPAREGDYLCVYCRAEADGSSKPGRAQVYNVQIESYDENAAPPDKLLTVGFVPGRAGEPGVIFLYMHKYDEENKRTSNIEIANFGVYEDSFVKALRLLGVDLGQ